MVENVTVSNSTGIYYGSINTWLPGVEVATVLAILFVCVLFCWLHWLNVKEMQMSRGRADSLGSPTAHEGDARRESGASNPLWISQTPTRKELMHQDLVSEKSSLPSSSSSGVELKSIKPYDPASRR